MSQLPASCMPSMLKRRTTAPVYAMSTMDEEVDKQSRTGGSIMFSLLPASIQSRIPRMPSLRRTKSGPMRSDPGKGIHYHSRTRSASGATTPISEATEADTIVASEEEDTLGALWIPTKRPDVLSELGVRGGPPGSAIEWRSGRPGKSISYCVMRKPLLTAITRNGTPHQRCR